jgi:hypothetical protein
MTKFLANIFGLFGLFSWLGRTFDPSATDMRALKLKKAELDLLEAEEAMEHWVANTPMLRERVARLIEATDRAATRVPASSLPKLDDVHDENVRPFTSRAAH